MSVERQQTTIPFTNNPAVEQTKRDADPTFDQAMNAFWRTYHTKTTDVFQCVDAAIKAVLPWRTKT